MKKYEDPKLMVIKFDIADILTLSEWETDEDVWGEGETGT